MNTEIKMIQIPEDVLINVLSIIPQKLIEARIPFIYRQIIIHNAEIISGIAENQEKNHKESA